MLGGGVGVSNIKETVLRGKEGGVQQHEVDNIQGGVDSVM